MSASLLLRRPRLLERVHAALRQPVTVLRAPAGYGKSVLLEHWHVTHRHVPVVTVRLHADDDRSTFARRLVRAVAASDVPLDSRTLGTLHDGVATADPLMIPRVIEQLSRRGPAVLVLDAFDTPMDEDVGRELERLAGRRQPGLHLALVARSEQGPQMVGLRAGRYISRLSAPDLAFTRTESRALVAAVAERDLSEAELDALHARTEGWPVAVHLAATVLRDPADVDVLLGTISGDNPFLAGLLTEIVEDLPIGMRRFAARASVLDQLTGPACDAVVPAVGSGLALRLLARRGLPVRAVPGSAGVFAYHPLLRDYLRRHLRRDDQGATEQLARRAATWHEGRGEADLAAAYLVRAGDWDAVIALVDRWGQPMARHGHADRVLAWLSAIPAGSRPRDHELLLRRTLLQTKLGQTRRAEHELRTAGADTLTLGEQVVADALRATWVFVDASPRPALEAAEAALQGLEELDDEDVPDVLGLTSRSQLQLMAGCSRGRALWCAGDVDAARACFLGLLGHSAADPAWWTQLLGAVALLEAWAGNLRLAHRYANDALRAATAASLRHHPAVQDAFLAEAHVRIERGELQPARAMLDAAGALSGRAHRPTTRAVQTVEQARWCLASGLAELGLEAIGERRLSGDALPPSLIDDLLVALELQLHLATGRVDLARSLAWPSAGERAGPEVAHVAVALAAGSVELARDELSRWSVVGRPPSDRFRHELYSAIVELESGDRRAAKARAHQLFQATRAEGHVQLVLDAGEPARHLLEALVDTPTSPYERHLIRMARSLARRDGGVPELTARERQVARYLPTPLSNAEIASQLFISVNTLKTHLRAIYRKLGVPGRREANQRLAPRLLS